MPRPHIEPFALGDFGTNCFVVHVPDGPEPGVCWIVDCGFEPQRLFAWIDARRMRPERILLTHAHVDHVAGLDRALGRYGEVPVHLHRAETGFCSDPMLNLSAYMGLHVAVSEPDMPLGDGDTLSLSGETFEVIHLPGHSPGCVAYLHAPSKQAIVGDTLFAGSIGRVDFPTSSARDMQRSLERLMELDDDVVIHPGHGPSTTIGRERRSNPFVLHGVPAA